MYASLPMYDWPETSEHIDKFWHNLQAELKKHHPGTPEKLTRKDVGMQWHSEALLLSQTCAYPLVKDLPDTTVVIGTPNYHCEYSRNGTYASPILVRQNDIRQNLSDFHHSTLAYNSVGSQSGFNALKSLLVEQSLLSEPNKPFFKESIHTGSHRASLAAVANGKADLCAIDPVCWALAQRIDAESSKLRVLTNTPFSPALPLISHRNAIPHHLDESQWREAITEAYQHAISADAKQHLLLDELSYIPKTQYLKLVISDLDMIIT